MSDHLRFFVQFLQAPRSVGAIAPSSRALALAMVSHVEFAAGRLLIEFGPGTGAFTREISQLLPAGMRYLGIEKQPKFVDLLRRRFAHLDFIQGDVEDLPAILARRGLPRPDDVISGLPFATLPTSASERILRVTRESLVPSGSFTTFQYMHAFPLPSARLFRSRMHELFGNGGKRSPVWKNLPPAFILHWQTPAEKLATSPAGAF